jgi:hypothetical protein
MDTLTRRLAVIMHRMWVVSLRCKLCNGSGPMPVAVALSKFKAEPTRRAGDVA